MIESLTGAREDISATELRALDLATAFPTREVTWDEQPMIAIHLPDHRETAWLLVPPLIWEKITRQLYCFRRKMICYCAVQRPSKAICPFLTYHFLPERVLQGLREPRQKKARRIDAGRMVFLVGDGWRLVVFADRDMKEERRQHIHQAWRGLQHILSQKVSD